MPASQNDYNNAIPAPVETVTQILARIEEMIVDGRKNEEGLDSILRRLEGPSPPTVNLLSQKDDPNVPPSHVIFRANRIEQLLEAHFNASRNAIARITNLL